MWPSEHFDGKYFNKSLVKLFHINLLNIIYVRMYFEFYIISEFAEFAVS